jgi:hypothetical protein
MYENPQKSGYRRYNLILRDNLLWVTVDDLKDDESQEIEMKWINFYFEWIWLDFDYDGVSLEDIGMMLLTDQRHTMWIG